MLVIFAGVVVGIVVCAAFATGLYIGWMLRDRNAFERGEVIQGNLIERPLKDPIGVEDFEPMPEDERIRD